MTVMPGQNCFVAPSRVHCLVAPTRTTWTSAPSRVTWLNAQGQEQMNAITSLANCVPCATTCCLATLAKSTKEHIAIPVDWSGVMTCRQTGRDLGYELASVTVTITTSAGAALTGTPSAWVAGQAYAAAVQFSIVVPDDGVARKTFDGTTLEPGSTVILHYAGGATAGAEFNAAQALLTTYVSETPDLILSQKQPGTATAPYIQNDRKSTIVIVEAGTDNTTYRVNMCAKFRSTCDTSETEIENCVLVSVKDPS